MTDISFVSHAEFPEDQYTKEIVYLLVNGFRLLYVRKLSKNGGKYWSAPNVTVTKDGVKEYYECFLQDSSFLEKDIKKYLEDRAWEKGVPSRSVMSDEEIPF